MKSTIATIIVLLLSSQVQADGFYQQLIGNAPQAITSDSSADTVFSYSPLYQQVISHEAGFIDEAGKLVKEFSYSPLYLQVTGNQAATVSDIAKLSSLSSDEKS